MVLLILLLMRAMLREMVANEEDVTKVVTTNVTDMYRYVLLRSYCF